MTISAKAGDCLKAATALGPEDTSRFLELHDTYLEAGMASDAAARKAASDLVAEIREEAGDIDKAVQALPRKARGQSEPGSLSPSPADDVLDDELRDALGHLGDVLGDVFGSKLNATGQQHGAGDLLPALSKVVELLVRKGFRSFSDAVGKAAQIMRADPRTAAHVDAISPRQWKAAYNAIADGHTGTDTEDALSAMTAADVKAIVSPAPTTAAAPAKNINDTLDAAIARGNMPKDNPALRKLVEQFDGQPATPERMKVAQESLEATIVRRARALVQMGADERATFDSLLALYQSQPNLNIRTSTSIDNQAYSTPAPLAYLGARLAGIGSSTKMYEPTAGNGMLAITAKPANVTATEMDRQRFEALKAQGIQVTHGDALKADVPAKSQDAVHTNPPFGPIKGAAGDSIKVKVDGYTLGQIDHLIAARALETMKDDGKATLIIGANKIAGGQSNNDLIFFNWLYGRYNVTSHFEVDGDLYARQGASWPVRVITINGRAESGKTAPKEGVVGRANTWEEVYERFEQGLAAAGRGARDGNGAVGSPPGADNDTRAVPAPAGRQDRRPDQGRPDGGPQRDGDVAGAGAGTVVDRAAGADRAVGERADAVRPDDAVAVGGGRPRVPGRTEAGRPAGDPGVAGVGNPFQAPYVARSARKDDGVLIPVNMAQPTQDALSRLEDEVGDIDAFAVKELGYKSVAELHDALMGLQVDSVASAIYQIKNGKGVVAADQTGIGKGRQAAAIIRWAAKQGHIPVFVTVKPSLFTDMHGDLSDIGSADIAPFIVNSAESIKGAGDEKLFANKPGVHKKTLEEIVEMAALPSGRNAVFMTYSQINVQNTQRDAVLALASRHPGGVVFILDESHNAGGDSATGDFIKEVLDLSKGVFYLSATYAKRPDNMPVYFKTDIGEAVADDNTLMSAMEAGGLPLQTVVANNLVKAGQMFRRERSYDGVNIESRADTAHRAEHVTMSDSTTLALRAIVHADRTFHENFVKAMQKEMAENGSRVLDMAGNQAQQSVDHTQFSSVVHNFVRQMLMGMKAQEAADDAIRSLKRGEKPLIAVENTMGSFLAEYAENNGLKVGDDLGAFDYRTVLSRALERSRYIIRQLPNGDKVREYIPMGKLDPLSFEAYHRAQKVIDGLKIDIPVSPIDWMRNEITKAGFSVAEVTGRNLSVDYTDPTNPKLSQIDAREQKDKVRTTRLFNAGELDAIILNVAGSTGISLHASEKFKDQKQRHMIVAQAAQDINIFMQMLGRIHRTGQVNLPKYTILSADLPAEIRPTALLSGKMKSLNANTSSNTESATSVKASDMLNKYGDQIVGRYLADNPELATALDLSLPDDDGAVDEDVARKATGRLALMPVKVQEAFYAEVEEQYKALIDFLNSTNQNELEPRTVDFDAQETKSAVLFEGQNKASPFGEDAIYGEYSVKAQGKAMKPDEIRVAMGESLGGKAPTAHALALVNSLKQAWVDGIENAKDDNGLGDVFDEPKFRAALEAQKIAPDYIDYMAGVNRGHYAGGMKRQAMQVSEVKGFGAIADKGISFISEHPIGTLLRVDINGDHYNAVVTNIRSTHKANGNPFSMSKIQVTIAVNGALRSVAVPATQFEGIETSKMTGHDGNLDRLFKEAPPNTRDVAKIVTGNLLGAYGELDGTRGSIITFTKGDGTTEQGILLPKSFNFAKDVRQDYRLKTAADAVAFLTASKNENIDRFGINSRDQTVRVLPHGKGGVTIQVPKSKLKGGKYFLNQKLRAITGDFYSVGSFMRANVVGHDAVKALDVLMQMNALYTVPSMQEEARQILNDPAPQAGAATGVKADADSPRFSLGAKTQAGERVQADVDAITAKWANAPEVIVAFDMADPLIPAAARTTYRERRDSGAAGSPEGFFLDGKVYLLSSTLKTPADTARVLLHEALGHAGLRGVFGPGLNDVLDRFADSMPAKVAAKAKEYGLDTKDTEQRRQAAEEVLAELAQTRPTLGSVQRLIAAVRAWLREHIPGFGSMKMSNAEVVQQFIAPARGWVERGQGSASGPVRLSLSPKLPDTIDIDGVQRSTTNSKGQAIAQTEEGVRNFWKWFADSRVVDERGRPRVLGGFYINHSEPLFPKGSEQYIERAYEAGAATRATGAEMPEWLFQEREWPLTAAQTKRLGMESWMADMGDPVVNRAIGHAASVAYEAGRKGKRKPVVVVGRRLGKAPETGFSFNHRDSENEAGVSIMGIVDSDSAEFAENTDQVSALFMRDRPWHYVVGIEHTFKTGADGEDLLMVVTDLGGVGPQVKSATANTGAFDPANPDIRFSLAGSLAGAMNNAAATRLRNAGGGEKIVGQTTRQYTPEQLGAMRNTGFAVQGKTLEERAKDLWKDAGKKLAQGLVDQFAPVKELSKDAYALLRLSKGASGAFEVLLQGGKLKLSDGVYDFDEAGRGGVIDALLKPLGGEHHDFFRWVAANRAERLMGEGKENLFTTDDIAALKTLADGTTKFAYTIKHGSKAGTVTRDRTLIYADSLKTFNGFQANVLDMAEQSGLIDAEMRQMWEHEFYVPFYRVEDDGSVAGANIKSGVVRQQAFKSLTGRENKLNADLLDNTLMNWAHLLDAAAKNRAAAASIAAAENLKVAAPIDGNVGKGSVWFMENGQKRWSFVDDAHLMTAITSLQYAGMNSPIMKAMGMFKHALTVGVTASPFFKVRNLIRDSVQVIGTSKINPNPLSNLSSGWKLTDPKSDAYFRLLAGGGTIHFGTMMEGSEAKRVQALVESGVDAGTILNSDQKVKAFYRKFIEPAITAYNELGNRGEAINRAALYDQLIKQGMSHAEASLQARDLMDFSMQGSFTSIRFLSQVVPFMNARIQGMYKLGRAAKEDPARMAAVVGATTAASLALLMAFSDDDDWKKREEWDRNNYWWFKFGGTAFRIPKPFEIGAVATLAERGFELAFDNEMTGTRFRQQVMTLLGDNLSMNPVPQLVKPMLDVYANVDSFSGRPIESMGMERLKSEYRFNGNTSMTARGISTAANAVTGLVGKESLSPLQVDHMLRGYFGWLGSFVVGAGDILARPVTGQPSKPDADVWKSMTGGMVSDLRDAPSRYVSQMYKQSQELEQAYATWRELVKDGKREEAAEFAADNRDQIMKYKVVEHVKKSVSRINQRIKAIEQGDADGAEKRERIRALQAQRDRMSRAIS